MSDATTGNDDGPDLGALWYPLCRALQEVYEPVPLEEEVPGPAMRRGLLAGLLGPRATVPRARRPVPEPANLRCNRIALAATSLDWPSVPPEDRDLLHGALASDAEFAPLLSSFEAALSEGIPDAPPPASDEADVPAFVFSVPGEGASGMPVADAPRPAADGVTDGARSGAVASPPPVGRSPTADAPVAPEPDVPPLPTPSEWPFPGASAVEVPHPRAADVPVPSDDAPPTRRDATTPAVAPAPAVSRVARESTWEAPPPAVTTPPPRSRSGLEEVDPREAPLVCELTLPDGAGVPVRMRGAGLLRPVLWPGTWEAVGAGDLARAMNEMADVGDDAVARLAGRGLLAVVGGVVLRPTEAPLLHVACRRTVRPMGRGSGWIVPSAEDGYRLSWRFPDGLGMYGRSSRGRPDRTVVTWDPSLDPGPGTGMMPDGPMARGAGFGFGLGHVEEVTAFHSAAAAALSGTRPDLRWHLAVAPVGIVAPEAFRRRGGDLLALASALAGRGRPEDAGRLLDVVAGIAADPEGDPREAAASVSEAVRELEDRNRGDRSRVATCLVLVGRMVAAALDRDADLAEQESLASAMRP